MGADLRKAKPRAQQQKIPLRVESLESRGVRDDAHSVRGVEPESRANPYRETNLPMCNTRRVGRVHGNALLPAKVTRSYESEETCVNDHRSYSGNRRSGIEDRIE